MIRPGTPIVRRKSEGTRLRKIQRIRMRPMQTMQPRSASMIRNQHRLDLHRRLGR